MEELLKKARRLTVLERKQLFEKGISILKLNAGEEDEAIIQILSMVYSDEELEIVKTIDQENGLVNAIVNLTYGVEEKDSKN